MKRFALFLIVLGAPLKAAPALAPPRPLVFEPGTQPHEYVAESPTGSLLLTPGGIEFAAKGQAVVRLALAGSRPVNPAGDQLLPSVSHYYMGNDSSKWRIGVANYGKVVYREVYPGIDFVFHGSRAALEYDFVLGAHADPSLIRMRFDGAKKLSVNAAGDLVVGGGLIHYRPHILQHDKEIDGRFRIHRDKTVSFDVGAYDHSQPLVIDPVITYLSYLGGSSGDAANYISVDKAGNVYVAGYTISNDFPGSAHFGTRPATRQTAFMSKFAPFAGGKTQLLFTIFMGDNSSLGFSTATAVTADPFGNIIITGLTDVEFFPTKNAIQTQLGGGDCSLTIDIGARQCNDAFLSKFSSDGLTLIFSTYYGGKLDNEFDDVTTDASGNIYAGGWAAGLTDLQGTPNAIQPANTIGVHMMIAKFDPNGKVLYSTYLGGSGSEFINSIALEKSGVLWIGGNTTSKDMPLPTVNNGFQSVFSGLNMSAFVARIDMNQNGAAGLTYATYFNGNINTGLAKLFLNPTGQVVFCGSTISTNLPTTPTALEQGYVGFPLSEINSSTFTAGDGYLARFNPSIPGPSAITYMSYIGGSDTDSVSSCGLDPKGNFVVSGFSASTDLFFFSPTSVPYKFITGGGGQSIFLIQIDPNKAAGLLDEFLLGGNNEDEAQSMAIDSQGFAYLTGRTLSIQFPVSTNAVQRNFGGADPNLLHGIGLTDAWVMQVDLNAKLGAVSQLVQASGDFQFGAPGSTLAAPIAVRLADASGNPLNIPGYPILFTGSNATVPAAKPLTDASGVASTTVQLSGDATVVASVQFPDGSGSTIKTYTFHLKALSGAVPNAVAIVSGDKQTGKAGTALGQPLVVELRDASNAPVPQSGLTVQFKATNASVSAATVVTDASGRASTAVTLGTAAGPATVQVIVGGLPALTATYTVTIPLSTDPAISAGGVVSAATYQGAAVSPGLLVTIFGANIGPSALTVNAPGADGKFSTALAATRVLFDGIAAPMIYASSGQTSAIVPYVVTGKTSTQVTVEYQGVASPPQTVNVTAAQPGLFSANSSGKGQGAILNEDNSVNSAANPAKRNSIVILFGTGEGQTTPAGVDGQTAVSVYPKPVTAITVKIGGSDGQVLYYGAAPTLVAGVLQVNVTIPASIPDGDAIVQLFEGSNQSPATITVAVKGDR